jgi:CRISPR-associated endonuclease/helicase Cas3
MANGGCAAVICNTVRRAQDIYRALDDARQKGALDLPEDDLILFHARFPPVWRQAIEQKVLAKFGKPDQAKPHQRPAKAIVVATQVIEQSLDLDFDLMLTDLAPIDLIIQRAGRLHRHDRSEAERHGLERRLVMTEPAQDEADIPQFENDRFVYEPYILLRSYLALQGRSEMTIPGDTTGLIEAVYGGPLDEAALTPAWQAALQEARRKMDRHRDEAGARAKRQLVLAPDNRRLLGQSGLDLDEESPDVHETFRAQTRDIDPGISLICLHRAGEQVFIHTKDDIMIVNPEGEIPREVIKQLQQNMITVQHKGLLHHFVDIQPLASWQKEAALRHCRPVIFEDGFYNDHPKYTLRLSQKLGLEIIKKELPLTLAHPKG